VSPGERVTPPRQRHHGGFGGSGGPNAQSGRQQGLLGPAPQAHTAFAPAATSDNSNNASWDAAGLIAALQAMNM
jgi:hypothetical protein